MASHERFRLPPLLRLLRPHHWIKNGFIVLPVPFAVAAGSRFDAPTFFAGLVGFCLLASSMYALNDIRDAESDRRSPRKRQRPVAAGTVSVPAAAAAGLACLAGAAALAAATGLRDVALLFGVYLATNVAYSFGAKNVPLFDVFLLASGFVIRVLVGCALVEAVPSHWLLLCSSALALFLGFAKRRGDVTDGLGPDHRPSLAGYNLRFLDAAMAISAGITLVGYALYCGEAQVLLRGRELAGLPFVAFAVFDYLRLAYTTNAGANPVELALTSRSLQVAGVLWLIATAWSLGLP